MKKSWDNSLPQLYPPAAHSASTQQTQRGSIGRGDDRGHDDTTNAIWNNNTHSQLSMPSHPYASAYTSMSSSGGYPSSSLQHMRGYETGGTGYPSSSAPHLAGGGGDGKRPRSSEIVGGRGDSEGKDLESDDEDDDDDDEDDDGDNLGSGKGTPVGGKSNRKIVKGADGKPKVKLTRGSRACIACRKIKMRCIPDDSSGPNGPCKRCKSGGHECIFEESNRGKRSTRKNEALAAKIAKMEAALKGIGSALSNLDQSTLNAFSHALHGSTGDPDVIQLISSHASPSAVPTLAIAMNRPGYGGGGGDRYQNYTLESGVRGEDSSQFPHPPLSPRLHSLPDNVLSPLGLLAEASLQNTDASKKHSSYTGRSNGSLPHRPSPLSLGTNTSDTRGGGGRNGGAGSHRHATSDVRSGNGDDEGMDEGRGVASLDYFKPGNVTFAPSTNQDERVPELLTIVSRDEIDDLFEIFFTHMAPHVPLIYKEFHTPDLVLQRSQFLCTVVCALAARYYTKRPDLHSDLSTYAKRLSFEVPSRGYKSVEVCQAYLLLSIWTLGPEKTFEQDRTWLMLGMAIRMATDLNLHRKSVMSGLDTAEGRERDLELQIINRERCWLHCFVLDRSLSAQMGKPYTLREDYIIRNACEASWHQQRFSLPSDRALSAYVVLQQIMSRAIDSIYSSTTTISGLRQDCDYMLIVRSAHEELRRWLQEWNRNDEFLALDGQVEYDSRAQFYFAYSSLVLYSFGLENALERAKMDISFFLTNVYEAATRVCTVVKEHFLPKGYLTYLPDTNFVMCSYALLSLLKLLKPELRPYHDSEEAIFKLVSEVADILEDCAIDPSHQPAIYAAFIREIVRKTREGRRAPSMHPSRAVSRVVSRAASPSVNGANQSSMAPHEQVFDPALLGEGPWSANDLLNQETQFAFIPQGGDMMILPSAAGPSESIQNSPSAALGNAYGTSSTPAPPSSGWAEYLPTFMSTDAFDGWDGSMLLPGFGRGQMTLAGGLLHSQFGSGLITPLGRSPAASRAQSRAQSRVQSRAQSPSK